MLCRHRPSPPVLVRRERRGRGELRVWLTALWLWLLLLAVPAWAENAALKALAVTRADDGVQVSFAVEFDLPPSVEDALLKGVPLYFVAKAKLFKSRWYWRDQHLASATRTWRLAYQPLTRKYRVSLGGLSQSFDDLDSALAVVRASPHWKIAELSQLEDDGRHYVEFDYRLDTTQLPRPMQIGFGTQAEWNISVERSVRVE